jgi:hypothetical protein
MCTIRLDIDNRYFDMTFCDTLPEGWTTADTIVTLWGNLVEIWSENYVLEIYNVERDVIKCVP